MGCDIHFYVEFRDAVAGRWISADAWGTDRDDPGDHRYIAPWHRFFYVRNYALFGRLAGVRRDGAIADPRGLPNDLSREVKAAAADWEGDGHNHSWFTLAELQAHDFSTVSPDFEGSTKWRMDVVRVQAAIGDANNVRCVFWFDN